MAAQGTGYVLRELPAIAQPWNAEALIDRASPQFLAVGPPDKTKLFVSFLESRLGPLKSMGVVADGGSQTFAGIRGFRVFAVKWVDCQFERGPARVKMTLVWSDGSWRIQGFTVNSDLLIQVQP